MKYSIVMPYYKRHEHLRVTLSSFVKYYSSRNDVEIIIGYDYKNILTKEYDDAFRTVLAEFNNKLNIKVFYDPNISSFNPAEMYNVCVSNASGKYIMLTNPEGYHTVDILSELDKENLDDKYVVCSCMSVDWKITDENLDVTEVLWYQHSVYNNRGYHFCSVISKHHYVSFGGFDNNFKFGIAYDDDDLRNSIMKYGLSFIYRDDLKTLHLNHESVSPPNVGELVEINRQYFLKKWS